MSSRQTETSREAQVDVVMPTLGGSPYLREALESVFAQTLSSWRLVVCENGSPSEEVRAALADFVQDDRVTHHVVGELITMPANWTRSIALAQTPYIAMLHDDDKWDPGFLARRVEFMDENPTCGFVFGGYRVIDESGRIVETVIADLPHGAISSSTVLPILYEHCLVTPPTALVRRTAYASVGPEYKEIFLTDYELWLRLAAHFDVGYLSVADADYRFHHAQNTARNRIKFGEGQLEVIAATMQLPVAASVRRRTRGRAHLLCMIDNVELGARREALRHLLAAVRSHPGLLARPRSSARILLAVVTLALGETGRRAFAALRLRRYIGRTGGGARAENRS